MDFTPIQNIILDLNRLKVGSGSRVCNLSGSAAALFFALHEGPFLAVESTEEGAEELCRDINFYRDALKKDRVFFLPEPDGPARSGERARVSYSLTETNSLVSSLKNLESPLWPQEEIKRHVMPLMKHLEIGREEIEQKLQQMGYKI